MPGAHVSSSDAIASFRASIISYLGRTRPIVEDVCDDVTRMRQWLEHDRRVHWENEVRRRTRELEAANQALYSARLSNLRDVTSAEQAAVLRARRGLTAAEEKLKVVKRWVREFDHRVGPLVKQLEQLRTMLSNDMPKAVLDLAQVLQRIDAYAQVAPTAAASEAVEPLPAETPKAAGEDS
jgi:hypothetical protein